MIKEKGETLHHPTISHDAHDLQNVVTLLAGRECCSLLFLIATLCCRRCCCAAAAALNHTHILLP